MSELAKVSRALLRDEAYESIRRAIVDGSLPPGANLRDADLAEQLGLSRAPVRQALTRLAADGLVDSKPQSYTRVAAVVPDDVRDALHLVRTLHEFAVRTGTPRMGPAEVSTMRAANARFAAAIAAGDPAAAIAADDEVHDVPVATCGNHAVAATLERYTPLLRRLEYARFSTLPAHHSVRRHDELIDAIEAVDVDGACRVTATIWTELERLLED
ncbi:GntR family transcriptional regulator [Amycolatopsis sp. H20-H5]|uniref:GntR family transcriptional regulator n=1 Tax=Amycolatopsis sp. H20-H5 TaxID=3046309 RepID=UPI002DBEE71E|nr:GntR family transcriptional regulator [Amycolatopsis sp. H20-H5]MEC3974062.1 GntR family transcriptional regulator [Amycolatopsis sp. H20-H5]